MYALRGTGASMLASASVPAIMLAERIGHTDPAFTYRTYVRGLEVDRRKAAVAMRAALSSPSQLSVPPSPFPGHRRRRTKAEIAQAEVERERFQAREVERAQPRSAGFRLRIEKP